MSKYFTIRHPLTIEIGGQKHVFYIRELGFAHFEELKDKVLGDGVAASDKERQGLELMKEVVLACVEEEDGSLSYSAEDWRSEVRAVVLQIGKAAMKAQGFDLDGIKSDEPMSAEDLEGNDAPSRRSGTNSASAAAPRSGN